MRFLLITFKETFAFYLFLPFSLTLHGQQLLDDFDRSDNATVGGSWIEEGISSSGAIVSNKLDFTTNSVTGQDYVYQDVSGLYTTTLDYSTNTVTWAFNISQNRLNPSGFDSGNYGIAFILGGTNSDFTIGNGYAVLFGQDGDSDPIRLVYYTGGLDLNSNLTDIISGNDYDTEHLSIRVTFNPIGDNWSLFVESGISFSDPTTALTQIGSTTSNAIYTALALDFVGCYYNHNSVANKRVQFEDVYIPSTPTVKEEPNNHPTSFAISTSTATTVTLTWTDARGTVTPDFYLIKGSASSFVAINDPMDGTFESDATFVQYIAQGTQIATISELSASTNYYFQIYSYSNTGTNVNYKTDGLLQQTSGSTIVLPAAWINELHYENIGVDADEFVEVAIRFPSSYTLSDFIVTLYNGVDGTSYDTKTLDVYTVGTTANNFTLYTYNYTNNGIAIQNGEPDGLALSYEGVLIQLLSYEGIFTAIDGVAIGTLSTDIGVDQRSAPLNGSSLCLSGIGNVYDDFTWAVSIGSNTLGTENLVQALPVKLVSFNVSKSNNSDELMLEWQTATELNNDYFKIQRSRDGYIFNDIGKVNGAGTSSQLLNYSFLDNRPLNGANYYRLIQFDFDGAFKYSKIRHIDINKHTSSIVLYPNPISRDFVLAFDEQNNCVYNLRIYNSKGILVISRKFQRLEKKKKN